MNLPPEVPPAKESRGPVKTTGSGPRSLLVTYAMYTAKLPTHNAHKVISTIILLGQKMRMHFNGIYCGCAS